MPSFRKNTLHAGEGDPPTFGDKVTLQFMSLTVAGKAVNIPQSPVTFSTAGGSSTVLRAVIGLQHGLNGQAMAILEEGFAFFAESLKLMRKGEWSVFTNEEVEQSTQERPDFYLSVNFVNIVPMPRGHIPAAAAYNPCPEDSEEGAVPVYLDPSTV